MTPPDPDGYVDGPPDLLGPVVSAIAVGVFVLLVLLVVRELLAVIGRHRARVPAPATGAAGLLEVRGRLTEMVRDDSERQRELALTGTPRNGIVLAWHRFEQLAAAAGIPRMEWETSAEFTLRILDLIGADDIAAARLGELYREARYSHHELGEAQRAEAIGTLDRIRASLPHGAAAR